MDEKCCCCKEPSGYVPIARVIDKLDSLAAKNDRDGIERTLSYWESEARALNDYKGLLEILSEQVGFYRREQDKDKGMRAVNEALALLAEQDLNVQTATIYLNCATTMKAFDLVDDSMPYYDKARQIYEKLLPNDDFRLAGFYNNYAAALADLGKVDDAKANYLKAIDILKGRGFAEIALSYVNLADLLYATADDKSSVEGDIDKLLEKAKESLDDNGVKRDGIYANVCAKCAPVFGFYGYFLDKSDLEKRAADIYKSNANA